MVRDPWQLVEHWWNGQWGWGRLDIYLHRDGDRWRVRALQRKGETGEDEWVLDGEARAHRYVRELKEKAPGLEPWPWRDIAVTHQHYD